MLPETSRYLVLRRRIVQFVLTLLFCCPAAQLTLAEDAFSPLELGQVKVGGEIGRRIDVTPGLRSVSRLQDGQGPDPA